MRLGSRAEVLGAEASGGDENVCLASEKGYALIFPVSQIPVVKGAGKVLENFDTHKKVLSPTQRAVQPH